MYILRYLAEILSVKFTNEFSWWKLLDIQFRISLKFVPKYTTLALNIREAVPYSNAYQIDLGIHVIRNHCFKQKTWRLYLSEFTDAYNTVNLIIFNVIATLFRCKYFYLSAAF